ncbi:DUF1080 domain-containing protein [Telmatocola sphagniphila]|uniref:DUF1080 domain-containing protein n=1 Tax=Telmatocola sphagniphila TaxID=1123043 RepID=A0A8E6EXV6_9BACT|nr:PVC-type heme-binding CxxCH protein [Telmatocola sphagniphila]QVL32033.1 DUF1080 domain-containing protein [Telmatocola sphagniphila]
MFRIFICCLLLVSPALAAEPPEGVLPLGKDGKPLNLDFETGTLKDWTATGEAFKGQPIQGDTVAARRPDMKSEHQGKFWIGTYEKYLDTVQGTLTSVPFKVTHPWASFLVGGGSSDNTCVEIVQADNKIVFFRASGTETENMRRVAVDLRPLKDKEIFIRLVDRDSGGWGHINFDDFRFHTEEPKLPAKSSKLLPSDIYKYAGLAPEAAAKAMTVPKGFSVSLFAGEPDVKQPIAFCFDDRGRLWVVEAYSYPQRQPEGKGKDRVVIFEDTTGTGKFDKRTVFIEGLNLVSGIAYGFGGLYIGAAPQMLYIPIKPGEDKPAGPPQVLLDGWGYEDTHETLNTFVWGPDGWLYGCHGVFTHSRVGKPGTPEKDRVPLNAGIWRFHPTKKIFEVFAEGTSNPWGLDFDKYGEFFCEACVIPHNWHLIQGGRFFRQAGQHFNPYTYADIPTIAVHRHWVGNQWNNNDRASSDSAGGGHAHAGAMIYQGGLWPKEYEGKMFMGNLHGHRLNIDQLIPKGSGYIADRAPDFLFANDTYAMFVNILSGPDGNAYLIDWYDRQTCHNQSPEIWDRSNGRIYKISYEGTKPVTNLDLQRLSDEELVRLLASPNVWYTRHASRILQERSLTQPLSTTALEALKNNATTAKDEVLRLHSIWALDRIGHHLDTAQLLKDPSPHVRAWAVRLAVENKQVLPPVLSALESYATTASTSPVERLALASALQRIALKDRWPLAKTLLSAPENAVDANLPLLIWYGIEPLADLGPANALELVMAGKIPLLQQFMIRRISSMATPEALEVVTAEIAKADKPELQITLLRAVQEGLKGRRQVTPPSNWAELSKKLSKSDSRALADVRFALDVQFGDASAFGRLREIVGNPRDLVRRRLEAMDTLLAVRDKNLPPVLQEMVTDSQIGAAAIRGLASFDDAKTPAVLLKVYPGLPSASKRDAVNTLASRGSYALALLGAIETKTLPANDVPAEVVRNLRNLNSPEIEKKIAEVWGIVRTSPAERLRAIKLLRDKLIGTTGPVDLPLGRAVFSKVCAQCHTLYGLGGKVGPDITGANRRDLNYLLENILDPSAVIPKEYAASVINLSSGRSVTGIIKAETKTALTVQTANEILTIPVDEIDNRKTSATSMMPEDLLKPLTETEVRSLISYLQNPSQTKMLATVENAKDFFNGKDLTNWEGDSKLWRVENGEIVGSTEGLKRNNFLTSQMVCDDFRLSVKVKLTPNKENSGIQFRSELLPDGEMRGPQADVGAGWWGKLYEESARGLIWKEGGEKFVKVDDWNEYIVEAKGSKIKTWINGHLCVDLEDDKVSKKGIFGLQIHSGGKMEVRFKDIKLEVLK